MPQRGYNVNKRMQYGINAPAQMCGETNLAMTKTSRWEPFPGRMFKTTSKSTVDTVPDVVPPTGDAVNSQAQHKIMCQQRRARELRTITALLRHTTSTTTAHGFAHLQATHVSFIKLFWIACIACCWGFFIFQVHNLVLTYRSTPVTTVIHPRGAHFTAPDITVCNPIPLSATYARYIIDQPNQTLPDVVEMLHRYKEVFAEIVKIHPMGTKSYATFMFMVMSQTFTRKMFSTYMGHQKQDMILEVTVNNVPRNYTAFELVAHHQFLNCYRLRLSEENFQAPIGKVSLYLYTDVQTSSLYLEADQSGLPMSLLAFSGVIEYDKSAGMVIFFTPRNYYPGLGASHVYASAGQLTDIKVKMSTLSLVNRNSVPCVDDPPDLELYDQISQRKVSYRHADDQCLVSEIAKTAVAECGCYPSFIPMLYEYRDISYCFDMNLLVDRKESQSTFLERISKFRNYSERLPSIMKSFLKNCEAFRPCHYIHYGVETSISRWPVPGLYHYLLDKMKVEMAIRGASGTPVFAWNDTLSVENNSTELDLFLKQNLIKLTIAPGESASSYTREEVSYKSENLFSDIGGLMGLLLGVSVLSLAEIVSLIMEIAAFISKQR